MVAVEPAGAGDAEAAVDEPAPAEQAGAGATPGQARVQASGKSRNPAWDWVSEEQGDIVIYSTRFKDLDPMQLQGVYTMLETLKKKAAAYLPAWAVK